MKSLDWSFLIHTTTLSYNKSFIFSKFPSLSFQFTDYPITTLWYSLFFFFFRFINLCCISTFLLVFKLYHFPCFSLLMVNYHVYPSVINSQLRMFNGLQNYDILIVDCGPFTHKNKVFTEYLQMELNAVYEQINIHNSGH